MMKLNLPMTFFPKLKAIGKAASVAGPEEPGRDVFVTWDACFIAVSRNAWEALLAVAEAASQIELVSDIRYDCSPVREAALNTLDEKLAALHAFEESLI